MSQFRAPIGTTCFDIADPPSESELWAQILAERPETCPESGVGPAPMSRAPQVDLPKGSQRRCVLGVPADVAHLVRALEALAAVRLPVAAFCRVRPPRPGAYSRGCLLIISTPRRCDPTERSAFFFFLSSSPPFTNMSGPATLGGVVRTRPPHPCGTHSETRLARIPSKRPHARATGRSELR